MAFAAVTSLANTIELLLESSRISATPSTETCLKYAGWDVRSLQRALHGNDIIKNSSEAVLAVEARIRDEARKLEDAIESAASAQFLSQSDQSHGPVISLDLDHLTHEIDYLAKTLKKMGAEYEEELENGPPHKEAAAAAVGVVVSDDYDMVGSAASDLFLEIRDRLRANLTVDFDAFDTSDDDAMNVIAITGMAGTGKTMLARKLFHDPSVVEKFECRAFVRVGQTCGDIMRDLIAQLNADNEEDEIITEGDESDDYIRRYFMRSFRFRKYVIVFDDVWDKSFRDYFKPLLTKTGYVLVTSRLDQAFYNEYSDSYYHHRMGLLKDDESWELLQRKVFGEEECPPLLVKAGKKIAENCDGLPLLIITVAKYLSGAEKETPEYWKEVAEMRNPVFDEACDQIYELLLPSYHYLDQNSKACFLYLYAFPNKYAIRRTRINNLWHAENFAYSIEKILDDMTSNNVVVIRQKRLNLFHKAKDCNLHVAYRHVSKRVGDDNKFLHILNRYEDEGVKEERYLAVYYNTLLAIKEVFDSIESSFSSLRSVLCTGPYHQYEVPICVELKLLRVLDAVSIRFYEFPVEVVKLIRLRYLSLTTNADLPPCISKLWFLQSLIVRQHWSIINRSGVTECSYVPVEIWELQELQHLEITGRNLPHPPPGATLPNLRELVGVGALSCDEAVIEGIPNIKKLKIQIESAPDSAQTTSCFDHIFCIEDLLTLRIAVVNPTLFPKPRDPPRLPMNCTSSLLKLTLSGFGYPWEDMSKIAGLPYLEVLKLQCYAFRGEKWDANEIRFESLKYLLIEDTDVEEWTAADETFKNLSYLTLRNCHKLKEIPVFHDLEKIELVDCNPFAETCAKKNHKCVVEVDYSWKK